MSAATLSDFYVGFPIRLVVYDYDEINISKEEAEDIIDELTRALKELEFKTGETK